MGHAAAAELRRAAGHQHPQHVVADLAGLVEAGERCLVPVNSFAEYAPEPNPETKKDVMASFSAVSIATTECPKIAPTA